jgi:diguanylate cyclase (GGDEF)-like protein
MGSPDGPLPGWQSRVTEALRGLSPAAGLALSALGILLVGAIDTGLSLVAGVDLVVTVLYLGPVSLAAWSTGARAGLAGALLASVVESASSWYVDPAAREHPIRLVASGSLELALFIGAAAIVAALRGHLERERQLSRTDDLTGLANRRAFEEAVELERLRVRRSRAPLSLAWLDLDGFKSVNDTQGHPAGDRLLVAVAASLRAAVRDTDFVARLGGDEFGVLLPGTSPEAARSAGERLRAAVRAAAETNRSGVAASVGVATFLAPPDTAGAALAAADGAMYDVKRAAKDGVRSVVVGGAVDVVTSAE